MGLYSEVYEILKYYGLRRVQDIDKIASQSNSQSADSQSLQKDLFEAFQKVPPLLEKELATSAQGLVLFIDASRKSRISDLLVRKAILFGSVSVFKVKGVRAVQRRPRKGRSFSKEYEFKIPLSLLHLLIRYKPLVEAGILCPVPAFFKTITRSKYPVHLNALAEALPIGLKNEALVAQLTEEDHQRNRTITTGYANLLLPSLTTLSAIEIYRLRNELYEPFMRFHRSLKKLLRESEKVDSENALLSLMEETDYQVRLLHSRVNRLKRARWLKGSIVFAKFVAASLVALIPSQMSPSFAGIFGTASLTEGLAFLTDFSSNFSKIHEHDFYFPWKIAFG